VTCILGLIILGVSSKASGDKHHSKFQKSLDDKGLIESVVKPLKCAGDSFVNGNVCETCSAAMVGCNKCTSATVCTNSVVGFYVDPNGHCNACPVGCAACTSATVCTRKQPGYYLDQNGGVHQCFGSCATCNDNGRCTSCKVGFFHHCGLCSTECLPGCHTCANDNEESEGEVGINLLENNNFCTHCQPDHVLHNGNCCTNQNCKGHCRLQNPFNVCNKCDPNSGYFTNACGRCISCWSIVPNCNQCVPTPDGGVGCSACVDGYTWNPATASCQGSPSGGDGEEEGEEESGDTCPPMPGCLASVWNVDHCDCTLCNTNAGFALTQGANGWWACTAGGNSG